MITNNWLHIHSFAACIELEKWSFESGLACALAHMLSLQVSAPCNSISASQTFRVLFTVWNPCLHLLGTCSFPVAQKWALALASNGPVRHESARKLE